MSPGVWFFASLRISHTTSPNPQHFLENGWVDQITVSTKIMFICLKLKLLASIENYFGQVSNGVYTIRGSNVVGWLTLPYSQKDVLLMANIEASAPIGSSSSFEVCFSYNMFLKRILFELSKSGYHSIECENNCPRSFRKLFFHVCFYANWLLLEDFYYRFSAQKISNQSARFYPCADRK